jgi:hypothetical protein
MKSLWLFLCFSLLVPYVTLGHELPPDAVAYEKSETCKQCHPLIYEEWNQSMHAKSSVHKDNAHAAVFNTFAKSMEKENKPQTYHCANCHAPMPDNLQDLMAGKAKPNPNEWKESEGVGCVFCHRIRGVVEEKSFNHYLMNQDGSLMVSKPSNKAPHKTSASPLFADSLVCLGCHSHMANPKGAAICLMMEEGIEGNCMSCHMKESAGAPANGSEKTSHRSHIMPGGHDGDMLKQAVSLDAKVDKKGDINQLTVTIQNLITHTFPSTNPMRLAFLKIVALNKDGKEVWTNFKDDIAKEDPQALFAKAFKANDKVGVPSWEAEAVAFDSRIKKGESRAIAYDLKQADIDKVKISLIYRLFPAKAIDMMGIPKDGVNEKNYLIHEKEQSLQSKALTR